MTGDKENMTSEERLTEFKLSQKKLEGQHESLKGSHKEEVIIYCVNQQGTGLLALALEAVLSNRGN